MAALPFLPFFVLKDFGQMMVFSAVYATLYLIAVRRWPQRLVLIGSVALVVSILVVGALPETTQAKIPLLPTIAKPVKAVLPDRIQQRFHLWLDGFDPPTPETSWWKEDYDDYYKKLVDKDPNLLGRTSDATWKLAPEEWPGLWQPAGSSWLDASAGGAHSEMRVGVAKASELDKSGASKTAFSTRSCSASTRANANAPKLCPTPNGLRPVSFATCWHVTATSVR
jgi:hypothetical protein